MPVDGEERRTSVFLGVAYFLNPQLRDERQPTYKFNRTGLDSIANKLFANRTAIVLSSIERISVTLFAVRPTR